MSDYLYGMKSPVTKNKILLGNKKPKRESFISYIDKLIVPEIKEKIDFKKDYYKDLEEKYNPESRD